VGAATHADPCSIRAAHSACWLGSGPQPEGAVW